MTSYFDEEAAALLSDVLGVEVSVKCVDRQWTYPAGSVGTWEARIVGTELWEVAEDLNDL